MKEKTAKTICVVLLTVLLSGCYPSEPKGTSDTDFSENYTENTRTSVYSDDMTSRDVNSVDKTEKEIRTLSLTLKRWDVEKIKGMFLDGAEIEEEKEQDTLFHPGEKLFIYDTKDERRVLFEPGRLIVDDKAALGGEFKYGTVFHYGEAPFATNEELSAFSRSDAQKRVNSMLDELGITNYGTPTIVPINAKFANEILEYHKEKAQEDFDYTAWSENEEIYVLHYPLEYEGIELAQNGFQLPRDDWATDAPKITAVVTRDKIISITADSIYSTDYNALDNAVINCGLEEARIRLSEFYSNLINDGVTKFNEGKLVYIPYAMTDDMTISFKPSWEFAGYTENNFFPYKHECYQYFYADNGARYEER